MAAILAFVVFPAKRVAVNADGATTVVVSRQQDMSTLLGTTGLKPIPGDVVVREGSQITVERARPVVVEADGRALSWRTRAPTVQALLNELSIEVSPYDTIVANGLEVGLSDNLQGGGPVLAAAVNGRTGNLGSYGDQQAVIMSIMRAVPLTLVEDGRAITFHSSRPTLEQVLRDAGIRIGPADDIYPSPSTEVTAGMQVEIKHAKAINLRIGNGTSVLYTHTETLKDALAEAGLALSGDDRVEPSESVSVTNGMSARLVRVGGRSFYEKEPVKRKTVFKPDESLSGSASKVVQGKDGVRQREYRVVVEDGVEKEKKLVREFMEPEAVDNVIYYAAASIRATGLPSEMTVRNTHHMYATWYNAASSGRPATDPAYGFTASGVPVTKGIVATDPSVIPLGTKLYIPGYGFATAGDTGGGVKGNMIDLGFPDGVQSDWHTKWVDVYILSP